MHPQDTDQGCFIHLSLFCRSKNEDSIFILDANTKELIFFESLEQIKSKGTANDRSVVKFELSCLKGHSEVQISNNFIDCQIDICSLEVKLILIID
jgi:translation initiation factor eIF-2B subunit epsilon